MRTLSGRKLLTTVGATLAVGATAAVADVRLPALFSDHMVVEAEVPVNVWGWADPKEEVTVSVAGQSKSAKADADGKWAVKLDKIAAGNVGTMTVSGKNKLTINDVLAGQVWVCSGQSNMAMTVNRALDFAKESAAANYPEIRQFKVAQKAIDEPQSDCVGTWVLCSPETVGGFTATGYFFGRELHTTLKTPVGLINSSVGGTPIESWIDIKAQRATPELKGFFAAYDEAAQNFDMAKAKKNFETALARWQKQAATAKKEGKPIPRKPKDPEDNLKRKGKAGDLFNGMIAPLMPYTIAGAIWYQGEANSHSGKSEYYQYHLSLLATDWRKKWGQGDFPVGWVQLPNFTRPGNGWPQVREGMMKALATPNTGMAITIDVGDPKDIHPANKQAVGKRLAQWALASVYGKPVVPSGPLPAGSGFRDGEAVVSFKYGDGLNARSAELTGFEIAGDDRKWHPAQAKIKGDTVVVKSADVKKPAAVRYCWADNPQPCLYNGAGLPASPFRTDDWPLSE
jgi:sialate O-acetylesterase